MESVGGLDRNLHKELIFDEKYWKSKSTFVECPKGVLKMREVFKTVKSVDDIFTKLNEIAQRKRVKETSRSNMMYLFFAYDKRDGCTWDLYDAFKNNTDFSGALASESYKSLLKDYEEFKTAGLPQYTAQKGIVFRIN